MIHPCYFRKIESSGGVLHQQPASGADRHAVKRRMPRVSICHSKCLNRQRSTRCNTPPRRGSCGTPCLR
nr:unnamed protein product [Callosobruchus analis]